MNGNADLLSHLPLPGTNDETNSDLRLTDPTDIDVYFIGASGVQQRLRRRTGPVLGGLTEPDVILAAEEVEHNTVPRTTDEQAQLRWQVMQSDPDRNIQQINPPRNTERGYAIRDDSPLSVPAEDVVRSDQLEPGVKVLHACPMTQEGREHLHPRLKH